MEQYKKYFDYLVTLRDSGKLNMFAAVPYLEAEFGLDRKEATDVLLTWVESFRDM
jgi:hypothetical protein